jgi:hypothetical protein
VQPIRRCAVLWSSLAASVCLAAPLASAADAADPRSEMIQALAAMAPHASLVGQARLFDRFVGTWDFDCVLYAADGGAVRFPGQWIFGWVLDGRALQDVWLGYQKSRLPGERGVGTSVRFYDAKAGLWRVVFAAPGSGKLLTLSGGAQGDRIVLEGQEDERATLRWSFNDVHDDSFLWRGETSADGGKTWRVEQEMRLRRRATRPTASSDGFLDALRAEGPIADQADRMGLYDSLLGDWAVDVVEYGPGGPRRATGEWHFAWVLEGRAIQDVWIVPPRGSRQPGLPTGGNRYGTSLRVYDPGKDVWHVTWNNPVTGVTNTLVGRKQGDAIVQEGTDAGGTLVRWTFDRLTGHSFRWRGEVSTDAGKTWRLQAEFHGRRAG